jgi:pyruvate ferredoxin oxidoreductase delta subunit
MTAPKPNWKDVVDGGVILEAGSSKKYRSGDWRSQRPVWDEKKCTQCMLCWINCPDTSIPVKDAKRIETDFEHCKGCGICAEICPVKCIAMKDEKDFL